MPPTHVRVVLAAVLLAAASPASVALGEGEEPRALASRILLAQVSPPPVVLLQAESSHLVDAISVDLADRGESQITFPRPPESVTERQIPTPSGSTRRPASLMPLYVSFGTLQLADAATTFRALDRGAVEANPVLGGLADNRAALLAVKAAGAAAVIYAGEKLWRRNRVAAVVLMAALNGAYAYVVVHNYRAAR